ncbi:DUF4253 domain-containing protein [Actinacidiphila glaucinigra]|uniref:DUF4253 domain-containing protein n=1 Tax=Actinacidiphila glaucinigra TaxID=235986 RepID=UPI0035E0EDA2
MGDVAQAVVEELSACAPGRQPRQLVNKSGARLIAVDIEQGSGFEIWGRFVALWPQTGFHPVLTVSAPSRAFLSHVNDESTMRDACNSEQIVQTLVDDVRAYEASVYDPEIEAVSFDEWMLELSEPSLAARLRPDYDAPSMGITRMSAGGRKLWLYLLELRAPYEIPMKFPELLPNARRILVEGSNGLTAMHHWAMLRSWYERFDARAYFLDEVNLELSVGRPPLTAVEAARVAIEQMAYCQDLIQDVRRAGDGQVRSTHWNFWWD